MRPLPLSKQCYLRKQRWILFLQLSGGMDRTRLRNWSVFFTNLLIIYYKSVYDIFEITTFILETIHVIRVCYLCIIMWDWWYFFLLLDVNECDWSPCQNNGTCRNSLGSYECGCLEGWQGHDCHIGKQVLMKLLVSMWVTDWLHII